MKSRTASVLRVLGNAWIFLVFIVNIAVVVVVVKRAGGFFEGVAAWRDLYDPYAGHGMGTMLINAVLVAPGIALLALAKRLEPLNQRPPVVSQHASELQPRR
jgi:hypothetical protein